MGSSATGDLLGDLFSSYLFVPPTPSLAFADELASYFQERYLTILLALSFALHRFGVLNISNIVCIFFVCLFNGIRVVREDGPVAVVNALRSGALLLRSDKKCKGGAIDEEAVPRVEEASTERMPKQLRSEAEEGAGDAAIDEGDDGDHVQHRATKSKGGLCATSNVGGNMERPSISCRESASNSDRVDTSSTAKEDGRVPTSADFLIGESDHGVEEEGDPDTLPRLRPTEESQKIIVEFARQQRDRRRRSIRSLFMQGEESALGNAFTSAKTPLSRSCSTPCSSVDLHCFRCRGIMFRPVTFLRGETVCRICAEVDGFSDFGDGRPDVDGFGQNLNHILDPVWQRHPEYALAGRLFEDMLALKRNNTAGKEPCAAQAVDQSESHSHRDAVSVLQKRLMASRNYADNENMESEEDKSADLATTNDFHSSSDGASDSSEAMFRSVRRLRGAFLRLECAAMKMKRTHGKRSHEPSEEEYNRDQQEQVLQQWFSDFCRATARTLKTSQRLTTISFQMERTTLISTGHPVGVFTDAAEAHVQWLCGQIERAHALCGELCLRDLLKHRSRENLETSLPVELNWLVGMSDGEADILAGKNTKSTGSTVAVGSIASRVGGAVRDTFLNFLRREVAGLEEREEGGNARAVAASNEDSSQQPVGCGPTEDPGNDVDDHVLPKSAVRCAPADDALMTDSSCADKSQKAPDFSPREDEGASKSAAEIFSVLLRALVGNSAADANDRRGEGEPLTKRAKLVLNEKTEDGCMARKRARILAFLCENLARFDYPFVPASSGATAPRSDMESSRNVEDYGYGYGYGTNLLGNSGLNLGEDDLQCPVCADLLLEATALPCGHGMCRSCVARHLDHALQREPICPLCRHPLGGFVEYLNITACARKTYGADPRVLLPCTAVESLIRIRFPAEREQRIREVKALESSSSTAAAAESNGPFYVSQNRTTGPAGKIAQPATISSEPSIAKTASHHETGRGGSSGHASGRALRPEGEAQGESGMSVGDPLLAKDVSREDAVGEQDGTVHERDSSRTNTAVEAQTAAASRDSGDILHPSVSSGKNDNVVVGEPRSKENDEAPPPDAQIAVFVCSIAVPGVTCSLHVFEPRYRLMMRRCLEADDRVFGMHPSPDLPYGCLVRILEYEQLPDGRSKVETVGVRRYKVRSWGEKDGYSTAQVDWLLDVEERKGHRETADSGAQKEGLDDDHMDLADSNFYGATGKGNSKTGSNDMKNEENEAAMFKNSKNTDVSIVEEDASMQKKPQVTTSRKIQDQQAESNAPTTKTTSSFGGSGSSSSSSTSSAEAATSAVVAPHPKTAKTGPAVRTVAALRAKAETEFERLKNQKAIGFHMSSHGQMRWRIVSGVEVLRERYGDPPGIGQDDNFVFWLFSSGLLFSRPRRPLEVYSFAYGNDETRTSSAKRFKVIYDCCIDTSS
ncbi:unnamed protein product [Amoebophrya sp. A25]|nr:unnamed protein product [Amoebophrya sp. A25]|eukprot:GSA25T00005248001.1